MPSIHFLSGKMSEVTRNSSGPIIEAASDEEPNEIHAGHERAPSHSQPNSTSLIDEKMDEDEKSDDGQAKADGAAAESVVVQKEPQKETAIVPVGLPQRGPRRERPSLMATMLALDERDKERRDAQNAARRNRKAQKTGEPDSAPAQGAQGPAPKTPKLQSAGAVEKLVAPAPAKPTPAVHVEPATPRKAQGKKTPKGLDTSAAKPPKKRKAALLSAEPTLEVNAGVGGGTLPKKGEVRTTPI